MTVCIAAYHVDRDNTPHIITACDRRISLFGGYFSQEKAFKFRSISVDWLAMFAGDVEEAELMSKAITKAMKRLSNNKFEAVLDCCKRAYTKQHHRLVETEILPEYDLRTYKEYLSLRKSDEAFFVSVRDKIRQAEENWNLLFAGFDHERQPHIFVISGPGKLQYCDYQQCGAIGTGAMSSLMWMAFYDCPKRVSSLGDATFGVASAKFFAERASDVGTETILMVMKPHEQYSLVFDNEMIQSLREKWEAIPVLPSGVDKNIDAFISIQFGRIQATQRLRPGKLRPEP